MTGRVPPAVPPPCPACDATLDALTASGLGPDEYLSGAGTPAYHCPRCGAAVERATTAAGWHWRLVPEWLAVRLRKARVYDAEHPAG